MTHSATPIKAVHRPVHHLKWRTLFGLAAVAGLLYLVLPHLGSFRMSLNVIGQAHWEWLLLAPLCIAETYLAAAGVYKFLAKQSLRYQSTLLVQLAAGFAGRIVPAGVGTLSVNFDFLRKQQHTPAEAGGVIATNNFLGLFGNLVLLAIAVPLAVPKHVKHIVLPGVWVYWLVGAAGVLVVFALLWSQSLRSELFRTILGVQRNIFHYRAHPLRLIGALMTAMLITLGYTVCLVACAHAVGAQLSVAAGLVIMTGGVALGTLTPTPGGVGGAEAGLLAGCLAYQLPSDQALGLVLLYRFFSYWLTLPVGLAALLVTERLRYL